MKNLRNILLLILGIIVLNWALQNRFFRIDLTSERRYTLSDNTKQLMKQLPGDIRVDIYLEGDLNANFQRLKNSTREMLNELNAYGNGHELRYQLINPSIARTDKERNEHFQRLAAEGIRPVPVTTRDKEGKLTQKIIFPYARLISETDTLVVDLLKNPQAAPNEENINLSIENLEFQFTDAIRRIVSKEVPKIAFLEGHGELTEAETYDFTMAYNGYFQTDTAVFRGTITEEVDILSPYRAVIIAKPQTPFTEAEKYILDQYIMSGGRVLWLIDGVRTELESLTRGENTLGLVHDVNLSDQLFNYGVRVEPVILQDIQSVCIEINTAQEGNEPEFQQVPWFYAPLLTPAGSHPVTRNLMPVKADFASTISLVGENDGLQKEILLTSSDAARAVPAPLSIGMDIINLPQSRQYFSQRHLPVGVVMSGSFNSVFKNRLTPVGVQQNVQTKTESVPTRMAVVADGDIIRNEVQFSGENAYPMPLGYDRCLNMMFGNRDFLLSTVLYLIDDDGWFSLRSREFKLRLLDTMKVNESRQFWQLTNVLMPIILLLIFGVVNYQVRKRKYA
ncbi:MAG: gliding motility-associated ABC transporter substrate-binding protein GldG [Prevotellaceae bacterium]|nr:gliding motility-associated ABC transporter substrate-binding protein GldG [Prevotellaceae bacterium]